MLERVADQLGAAGEAQLLLDVGAVALHRADADVEPLGDLGIGVAQRDQAQDVALAVAQIVAVTAGLTRGQARAQRRLQVGVTGGGAAHRLHQLRVGGLLEHVTAHAGLQGAAGKGGLVLHRQHDDLGIG